MKPIVGAVDPAGGHELVDGVAHGAGRVFGEPGDELGCGGGVVLFDIVQDVGEDAGAERLLAGMRAMLSSGEVDAQVV